MCHQIAAVGVNRCGEIGVMFSHSDIKTKDGQSFAEQLLFARLSLCHGPDKQSSCVSSSSPRGRKVQGYKNTARTPADATLPILRVDDSLLPGRGQFTKSLLPIISTDR